jgi:hypothetical protein
VTEERLSRMEDKIDKLSEAVVYMARIEERIITVFKRMDNMEGQFKKFDDRMDELEKQAIQRGQKIAFAERVFWMVLTAAVGLCFVYMR